MGVCRTWRLWYESISTSIDFHSYPYIFVLKTLLFSYKNASLYFETINNSISVDMAFVILVPKGDKVRSSWSSKTNWKKKKWKQILWYNSRSLNSWWLFHWNNVCNCSLKKSVITWFRENTGFFPIYIPVQTCRRNDERVSPASRGRDLRKIARVPFPWFDPLINLMKPSRGDKT